MGRHRRSAAGRAATGRAATGVTQHDDLHDGGHGPLGAHAEDAPTMGIAPYLNPEAYAETAARSEAYLFATENASEGGHSGNFTQGGFSAGAAHRENHQGYGHRNDRFSARPDRSRFADTAAADTAVFASDGLRRGDLPQSGSPDDGFTPGESDRHAGGRRRKKKAATPVRTGLLGVSAAVALGTVAVATGVVPGLDNYKLGGDRTPGDSVEAAGTPTNAPGGLGGTSDSLESPSRDAGESASRDADRAASPAPSPSDSSDEKEKKTPESKAPAEAESAEEKEKEKEKEKPSTTPSEEVSEKTTAAERRTAPQPEKEAPSSPVTVSEEAAAGAQVLRLVNQERAKVGCSPVAANSALTGLATAFSKDMADRGFFDHTDPDGDTPWDRASAAGISDLGGENIARGQATAAAAMEAWMNSPGHKANILNCDFKTLGVGVHFGSGGPWWTQNFGY
ncbi:CAP domain-containing protein [Streptomyces sp. KMM 9044]|uniref:CAP domain-containing protein n=1 Tax=Streptomyces sp. KMM 9044 TaxID=2744474 RepID=UPI002151B66D|nr:CAP domain-containing protein [Streptomyces sp. KMM 9044]WAX77722.1 CAP domain-containing protein [Streptomyces sp. KMM 9044]